MLDIAEKIIAQQEAQFDPARFEDRYEEALRELIARKKKGQPVTAEAPEEKEEKVVDLMAALKESLRGGGSSRANAERFMAAHKQARKVKAKARAKKKATGKRAA